MALRTPTRPDQEENKDDLDDLYGLPSNEYPPGHPSNPNNMLAGDASDPRGPGPGLSKEQVRTVPDAVYGTKGNEQSDPSWDRVAPLGEQGGPSPQQTDSSSSNSGPKSLNSSDLDDAEDAGGVGNSGKRDPKEPSLADTLGKGYTSAQAITDSPFSPMAGAKLLFSSKKGRRNSAAVGGVIATFFITFLIAGVSHGPFKIVQLSEIFQKPQFNQNLVTAKRTLGVLRWAQTGDVGTTRLSILANSQFPRLKKQMAAKGVVIEGTSVRGFAKTMTFDTSNPRNKYYGKDNNSLKSLISKDMKDVLGNFPEDKIKIVGNGTRGAKVEVDLEGARQGHIEEAVKIAAQHRDNGTNPRLRSKIYTAMVGRWFKIVYKENPNWFHPFEKIGRPIDKAVGDRVLSKAKNKAADAEFTKKVNDKYKAFIEKSERRKAVISKVRAKANFGVGAATGALLAQGTICIAKDLSDEIPALNRAAAVVPAMKAAVQITAMGAQIKSGQSVSMDEVGAVAENLKDANDKDIFEAKSLRAEAGMNGGEDMDEELKEGFNEDSNKDVDEALDSIGADKLCSDGAKFAGVVAGTALIFVPGASVAGKVLSTGVSFAAMAAVQSLALKLLTAELATGEPHKGPNGGNVDMYGAREYANATFRKVGGAGLSAEDSAAFAAIRESEDKAEFESRSFADRIFDRNDYRSLAGQAINNSTTDIPDNISNVASAIFSSPLTFFVPKVSAAPEPYNYPFPEYGIPLKILDDSRYQNPFANEKLVAQMLGDAGGSDTSSQNTGSGGQGGAEEEREGAASEAARYCNDKYTVPEHNSTATQNIVRQNSACRDGYKAGFNQGDKAGACASYSDNLKTVCTGAFDEGKKGLIQYCDNKYTVPEHNSSSAQAIIRKNIACKAGSEVLSAQTSEPSQNSQGQVLAASSAEGYIKRAKACFGVDIVKDSDAWDAKIIEDEEEADVNPASGKYKEANCGDWKDENWVRIKLWLFDLNGVMKPEACYNGDDEKVCEQLGISAPAGSDEPTSDSVVSEDAKELAKQILANNKISLGCRHCKEDIQNTANGKPAYGDVKIEVELLQFLAELGEVSQVTVTSITGNGCGHSNNTCVQDGGTSNHYKGKAVDLACSIDAAKADKIGKKFGYVANNERCPGTHHFHFSADGY